MREGRVPWRAAPEKRRRAAGQGVLGRKRGLRVQSQKASRSRRRMDHGRKGSIRQRRREEAFQLEGGTPGPKHQRALLVRWAACCWRVLSWRVTFRSLGSKTRNEFESVLVKQKKGSESEVAQSCPTLSDPVDCSLPGSSVHGLFQAREVVPLPSPTNSLV